MGIEPEQSKKSKCRWRSRANWKEYCVGCAWGSRFGCELDRVTIIRRKQNDIIPDGEDSVRVGRFFVKRTGRR